MKNKKEKKPDLSGIVKLLDQADKMRKTCDGCGAFGEENKIFVEGIRYIGNFCPKCSSSPIFSMKRPQHLH
jgi:hypothetical protein